MKKTQVWLILPIFFLLLGLILSKLNLLEDIGIEIRENKGFSLQGKAFKGTVDDKALGQLMEEVFQLSQEKKLPYVVYYKGNPDQTTQPIDIFVGLKTTEPLHNYQEFVLKPYKSLRTEIENSFFAPNPANVNKAIKEFAVQQKLQLNDIYIEFYGENKVCTEIVFTD